MINFFEEGLREESIIGERSFRGKPVALMLRNRGVELIYQSPYSPELNPCEFCWSMNSYLRQPRTGGSVG